MAEWDFLIFSQTLKDKQEGMQICLTKIIDALSSLKQEADSLEGVWQGSTRENFMAAFTKAWEKAEEAVSEAGGLIGVYVQIESSFEDCEKEIEQLF